MNVYRIQRCIWINRNYLIDYCSVVNEKEWIDMDYIINIIEMIVLMERN
jgi:hypothetical protein